MPPSTLRFCNVHRGSARTNDDSETVFYDKLAKTAFQTSLFDRSSIVPMTIFDSIVEYTAKQCDLATTILINAPESDRTRCQSQLDKATSVLCALSAVMAAIDSGQGIPNLERLRGVLDRAPKSMRLTDDWLITNLAKQKGDDLHHQYTLCGHRECQTLCCLNCDDSFNEPFVRGDLAARQTSKATDPIPPEYLCIRDHPPEYLCIRNASSA